ncbi:glycosyltransferase [Xanthomonas arboricola]|uniref:glycosyltransferase n=1 Tax=Xanthomonas arboricola TaxID=56448 RepID=UPI0017D9B8DC|nr:glycosyltransferase [Xanthomonas arboricola]MBB4597979.1 hypothetical protein [Xanthomonas arboricola]MBB4605063.1 hypothetical protein [Xanthomonas arboricola]MBB4728458.1 hypothetical protein [Xanthomonas arboricola]
MNVISKLRAQSGIVVALMAVIALVGCSRSPDAEQPAQGAVQQQKTVAEAPEMSGALTQDQAGARYAIASDPVIVQNGALLRTVVSVTNLGKVMISSTGKLPVNLAISLADRDGAVLQQDFVRASLPTGGIAAGSTAEVTVEVPTQAVLGKVMRFGLVQESVAWYSDFKIEPIDYGPITACQDQGKQAVCGAGGKPLATR